MNRKILGILAGVALSAFASQALAVTATLNFKNAGVAGNPNIDYDSHTFPAGATVAPTFTGSTAAPTFTVTHTESYVTSSGNAGWVRYKVRGTTKICQFNFSAIKGTSGFWTFTHQANSVGGTSATCTSALAAGNISTGNGTWNFSAK